MNTYIQKGVDFIQAGLDESIVKFFWGLVATVVAAAGSYAFHHLTGQGSVFVTVLYSYLKETSVVLALMSFWHWAKTTAEITPTTQTTTVTPVSTEVVAG